MPTPKLVKVLRDIVLIEEVDGSLVRYRREQAVQKKPVTKKRVTKPCADQISLPNVMIVLNRLTGPQIREIQAELKRNFKMISNEYHN